MVPRNSRNGEIHTRYLVGFCMYRRCYLLWSSVIERFPRHRHGGDTITEHTKKERKKKLFLLYYYFSCHPTIVQHDLQHWSLITHNVPERRKPRKQKETHMHQAYQGIDIDPTQPLAWPWPWPPDRNQNRPETSTRGVFIRRRIYLWRGGHSYFSFLCTQYVLV